MQRNPVEIRLVDSWSTDEIVALYTAAGWWKEHYNKADIASLITGSFVFAVAVEGSTGKAIGMGRVLSDGVSDAYIQDVVIHPLYRDQGWGKKLIEMLVDYCLSKGISWIGLIAEPGSKEFYIPLGFKEMKKYTPLLYQPKE